MKCGIEEIDQIGFPEKGTVVITGSSYSYQSSAVKNFGVNLSPNFSSGIVISTKYGRWHTRDIAETPLAVLDTDDVFKTIREFSFASNRDEYPIVFIDELPEKASAIDINAVKNLLDLQKNALTIINCSGKKTETGFDLLSLLISSAVLTIQLEENNGTIKISLLGPLVRTMTEKKEHQYYEKK